MGENFGLYRRALSLAQMAFTLMNTIVLGKRSSDPVEY